MCITAGSERYSSSQTFLISEKKWRRYSLSGTENVYKNIFSSILSYISQTFTDQGLLFVDITETTDAKFSAIYWN